MRYKSKEYVFVNSDSVVTTMKKSVWFSRAGTKCGPTRLTPKETPKWTRKWTPKWTPLKLDNFANFNTEHNKIAS